MSEHVPRKGQINARSRRAWFRPSAARETPAPAEDQPGIYHWRRSKKLTPTVMAEIRRRVLAGESLERISHQLRVPFTAMWTAICEGQAR